MSPARRAADDDVVLTTPKAVRRQRETRFIILFVLMALPVAAVLFALIGLGVAVGYVVVQTAFLTFGLRRRQEPVLRLTADGIEYEPGRFVIRCGWADVVRVGAVDLPLGKAEGLVLGHAALHWSADIGVRDEVRAKGWDRVIPLTPFEPEWRGGRIGAAVGRWGPTDLDLGRPPEDR